MPARRTDAAGRRPAVHCGAVVDRSLLTSPVAAPGVSRAAGGTRR